MDKKIYWALLPCSFLSRWQPGICCYNPWLLFSFCAVSGCVYIMNDYMIGKRIKSIRKNGFALRCGQITPGRALLFGLLLLLGTVAGGWYLDFQFAGLLIIYFGEHRLFLSSKTCGYFRYYDYCFWFCSAGDWWRSGPSECPLHRGFRFVRCF